MLGRMCSSRFWLTSSVCCCFNPRSAAILLGASGILATLIVNYLSTYHLYVSVPAIGSFPYQYHAPLPPPLSDEGGNSTNNPQPDVHWLYSNLGCGMREHKLIYHHSINLSHTQIDYVKTCAALLPWYKILWYPYMAIHVIFCAMLIAGAYLLRRELLLPWLLLESAALIFHLVVGAIVLLVFLSPEAYEAAAKIHVHNSPVEGMVRWVLGSYGGSTMQLKVVRDWAVYLFHIPWRMFWISVVVSLYCELEFLLNSKNWEHLRASLPSPN